MAPVASSGTASVTLPTDTEILITREFDAPVHLVYEAWTTPELVKRWWAGNHGNVTTVEMDLRVGGRWRFVIRGNEGFEVAFHGVYREVVPNERIANTEVFEGMPLDDEDQAPLNIVTFTAAGDRTILTLRTQCHTRELRDMIIESGMESGMQAQMDMIERIAIELG
jgi:uncharacterized protein YndB with AHSA1/START domain